MARTHRRTSRCQTQGCRGSVCRAETIELPATWAGGAVEYLALPITVGLCRSCAREVARRLGALFMARQRLLDLEQLLVEAEGALAYERELAALAHGRDRRAAAPRRALAEAASA